MFQIAATHVGEPFDSAKDKIDDEYVRAAGRAASERHGGNFQTWIQVAREAGLMYKDDGGSLQITEAGKQALVLLGRAPDFLKAVPYFVTELLARYQLNNPARPAEVRGEDIAAQIRTSNVFPYWTIWKIMRSCDNYLTSDEIRRFVLRLRRNEDLPATIDQIKAFRKDVGAGMSQADLDKTYPTPLTGAVAETKYIMGRAGAQIGDYPPLIQKPENDRFAFNPSYLRMVDMILANEPVFREQLTETSWMVEYGKPVPLPEVYVPFEAPEEGPVEEESLLPETDPVLQRIRSLMSDGALNFLLSGPPGTSKSWYARRLAYALSGGKPGNVRLIQFHPSYGYEDFIEGYIPHQAAPDAPPTFRLEPKVLMKAVSAAGQTADMNIIVIDEFTRGDAGRIFGEALTYIEPEYRGQVFTLASGKPFAIPKNLLIVATMNPYDRSITDIDAAMQRRFEILQLGPNREILRTLLTSNKMEPALIEKVMLFFDYAQSHLPFGGLGHTYFLRARDPESLERIWAYKLEPLFEQLLRYEKGVLNDLRAQYPSLPKASP